MARSRRVASFCSYASVAILCVTVVLVAVLFIGVVWLRVIGQLGYASIVLAWVYLPPVGIVLGLPGMRRPRLRRALVGLFGNIAMWLGLQVAYIAAVLIAGP